jgi:hypothetical protein
MIRSWCNLKNASTKVYYSTGANPILSLRKSLPREQLTQESMLLKVEDLTPLEDSFAVVQIGGHQV